MKKLFLLCLFVWVAACAGPPPRPGDQGDATESKAPEAIGTPAPVHLENYGPAPELENEVCINTEQPLRLADLRGKVVLLDMWTFG